jgi:hypothetical protein
VSSTPPVQSTKNTLSIIAIVCGVVAILFLPIILGPVGIVLAIFAMRNGERLSKVAMGVAIGGMLLGLILAFAIMNSM